MFSSLLGAYDTSALDRLLFAPRPRYVEFTAHEAAFIPSADWSLFRFRMDDNQAKHGTDPDGWFQRNRSIVATSPSRDDAASSVGTAWPSTSSHRRCWQRRWRAPTHSASWCGARRARTAWRRHPICPIADDLRATARWQGLAQLSVSGWGDAAGELAAALPEPARHDAGPAI